MDYADFAVDTAYSKHEAPKAPIGEAYIYAEVTYPAFKMILQFIILVVRSSRSI